MEQITAIILKRVYFHKYLLDKAPDLRIWTFSRTARDHRPSPAPPPPPCWWRCPGCAPSSRSPWCRARRAGAGSTPGSLVSACVSCLSSDQPGTHLREWLETSAGTSLWSRSPHRMWPHSISQNWRGMEAWCPDHRRETCGHPWPGEWRDNPTTRVHPPPFLLPGTSEEKSREI